MTSSTSLLERPTAPATARLRDRPLERPPTRPPSREPGLTVVLAPAAALPAAAAMLRPGPALGVVPSFGDPVAVGALVGGVPIPASDREALEQARLDAADRALDALAGTGMEVLAIETVPADDVERRMGRLADEDVSCVLLMTRSAREARRVARAAHAPVLAVPPGAAPALGPAVMAASDAPRALPAAARCLATARVAVVAGFDPVATGTLVRSAAHPVLVPRLLELAEAHRRDELDGAGYEAELAAVIAGEHGLEAEPIVAAAPVSIAGEARARDGVTVVVDRGGLRAPRALREALAGGRPALLVP